MSASVKQTGWYYSGGDFVQVYNDGNNNIIQIVFRCYTRLNDLDSVHCRTYNYETQKWNNWVRLDIQ